MEAAKRANKTVINTIGAELRDGKIYGCKATLTFTVAMNKEEGDKGNFKQIDNLTVVINGVKVEDLIAEGLKAWKVKHQSPMRDHITEVEALSGTTVKFDDQLFTSTKKGGTMSYDKAEELAMKQDRLTQIRLAIKLMRSNNMPVPDALLEEEVLLKMMQEEEQEVVK